MSETAKMIKHIYYLRKSMYQFLIMMQDNYGRFGNRAENHYLNIYYTMVNTVVHAESDLQMMMTIPERNRRRTTVYFHPYQTDDLQDRLSTGNLMVTPEIEAAV